MADTDHNPELIGPGGKVDRDALFAAFEASEEATGDDEAPVTVRFELSRDLEKRLDKYLVDRIPFISRTSLQQLIKENAVTVNGRTPKASTKLRKGDVVVAVLPPPPSSEIPAENIPLDVLYEDDDLIVINKADDIIVHPARGHKTGTLINALAWRFQHETSGALSSVGKEFARPGVVHRLDRHTTGVMVAAKSDTAHWRLGKQFENRTTDKRYLAVVHGHMEPHADVIDLPLGHHPTQREKYAVRWDSTGKASVTIYRVREVYDSYTLVELELKTGRTHQIRVHLSHIGFPIVGDDIYGGKHLKIADVAGFGALPKLLPQENKLVLDPSTPRTAAPVSDDGGHSHFLKKVRMSADSVSGHLQSPNQPLITRQALHAAMLSFAHPMTRQPMTFQAPLHGDMRLLVQLLRQHRFISAPKVSGTVIDLDLMMQ